MNKFLIQHVLLFSLFSLLFVNESSSQSLWSWVNPYPFGTDIGYLKFLNEYTGYTVIEGNIYKTTNSGTNWIIPGDSSKYFSDADFIDFNNGFVSGAFIKKTTNGGFNWIDITYYTPTVIAFNTLTFLNNNTGYVGCAADNPIFGTIGLIIKTTNGGLNWTQQSLIQPNTFIDIEMLNTGAGKALAIDSGRYKIYKTNNFGNNWISLSTNITGNSAKSKLKVIDELKYFLVTNQVVYATTDGGYNWKTVNNLTNINNIEFPTNLTGYAIGKEGKIYNTTDEGAVWYLQYTPLNLEYYGISFINQNTGFVSGKKGAFLKTTNAGTNWNTDTRSFTYQNLNDIKFLNRDTLLVVSDSGKIFKSINQGANWQSIYTGVPLRLTKMQFLNVNTGFAMVRDSGYLLKTTNCGTNWIKQTVFGQMYSLSFYFINENTGYFSGSEGGWVHHFYKTTNGGFTWTDAGLTEKFITSIKFLNSLTGFIGTSGDGIYKTTDGGLSWVEKFYNTTSALNIYDFGFFNNTTIIACDDDRIFISSNGGDNWSFQTPLVTSGLVRIKIIDSSKGYVTGGSSLFYTSTGGSVWLKERFPYNSSVAFGVDFFQKKGFVVGFQGNMLTKGSNDTVSIKDITTLNPETCLLYQNYPNPFNASTSIVYELKKGGIVKLKIYDISGKEIKLIFSKIQSRGVYRVRFRADNLSSGIYFYSLSTENFTETKKMLLIK